MTTIFREFDDTSQAFINPSDFIKTKSYFPEIAVTTFSEKIINQYVKTNGAKEIASLYSSNGVIPVYQTEYKGKQIALYLSRVGAPACVVGIEEIIALGAKKIVLFGSCGVLNETAAQGKIIIPTSAFRDEGTSYHYIPASDELPVAQNSIEILKTCLNEYKIPFIAGKVWTTDAVYRETPKAIAKRKQQGCLAVEMECSAALAVTQFRNIPFVQFLFGADNLDCEIWEIRDLIEYGEKSSDKYITLAFECGIRL